MKATEIPRHREDARAYYATQSIITSPGRYRYLYEGLPDGAAELCEVVQGLMIHVYHAQRYGVELSAARKDEVRLRKVQDILGRAVELDNRALIFPREPAQRVVGNCRDYAVLLCSLLRHQGVAARVRCGFATYFTPGRYEDHWICEYWDDVARRWRQVDAQMDEVLTKALKIEFNVRDLPAGKFLTAGQAWRRCRSGKLEAELCGIGNMKGLWFVWGNVVRDFLALNKMEILPWDGNALIEAEQLSAADTALLDKVAQLTTMRDLDLGAIRSLYEANRVLRMPEGWVP